VIKYFILIAFCYSCTGSLKISKLYTREYYRKDDLTTNLRREYLEVNVFDSLFVWKRFDVENYRTDTIITYGVIKVNGKNINLIDTVNNKVFCLIKRGRTLFFYDCKKDNMSKYPHPFKSINTTK